MYGIKKYHRISPSLAVLHWLPVEQRIDFKILLLVYKFLQGKGPIYLCELLVPYQPQHTLRAEDKMLLVIPTYGKKNLKTYEERSFCVAVPRLWNDLPWAVKSTETVSGFKKALTTHLFQIAHGIVE